MLFKLLPLLLVKHSLGWVQSYKGGQIDRHNNYLGGSEILHLQGHGGRLFAAVGYWEDTRNCIYNGQCWNRTAATKGWGQVLRLDSESSHWESDLELGVAYLRTETLASLTFTTDNTGQPLATPVVKLVAAAFSSWVGSRNAAVWIRNDTTSTWEKTVIVTGKTTDTDIASVRSLHVYKDAVTGVDRAFITIGTLGVFSGAWDLKSNTILWEKQSETAVLSDRSLGQAEVNGALYFSSGNSLYKRIDGNSPSWKLNFKMPGKINPAVGGIRGLSVLSPGPSNQGDSLLFVWCPDKSSQSCIYRLDSGANGSWTPHKEICLADVASVYLGTQVLYSIGGYNRFMSLKDPQTGNQIHLVGFEARIKCSNNTCAEKNSPGLGDGYYSGALFFIRQDSDKYGVNEVGGPPTPASINLVSTRAYEPSPFSKNSIFFAGYDCNDVVAPTNTAWIYKSDIQTAITPLNSIGSFRI